ncbi:MAG: carboxymuconolactone decarboxylase family protein [Gemmatimonadaceae bacterium]
MSRINPIDVDAAQGATATHLAGARKMLGRVANLFATAAQSTATVGAMVAYFQNLGGGPLGGRTGEQIAVAVAQANGCDYCLSAHTAIGQMHGLTADEMDAARWGRGTDAKTSAAIALATVIVETRGHISDEALADARAAGLSDSEIVEVVAHVGLNVFTNYLNNVAQTVVDFPLVALVNA